MHVPVSEAKSQLTELVRRAEAGEDIVLTRHGRPVVRIAALQPAYSVDDRRRAIEAFRKEARLLLTPGPSAARSQDFLYDNDGMPR